MLITNCRTLFAIIRCKSCCTIAVCSCSLPVTHYSASQSPLLAEKSYQARGRRWYTESLLSDVRLILEVGYIIWRRPTPSILAGIIQLILQVVRSVRQSFAVRSSLVYAVERV